MSWRNRTNCSGSRSSDKSGTVAREHPLAVAALLHRAKEVLKIAAHPPGMSTKAPVRVHLF